MNKEVLATALDKAVTAQVTKPLYMTIRSTSGREPCVPTVLSPSDIQRVAAFVQSVGASDKTQLLEGKGHQTSLLGQGVYVSRLGPMRLYFTIGNDAEGDYVLLLDATIGQTVSSASRELFATKNPKTNSSLNPHFNASINPRLNASINPRLNASINPRLNASINPRLNASINPRLNASINPRLNASINPRLNPAFGGPYLYNSKLQQQGYIVRANDDVELLFDLSGNHVGELVRANNDVKVQFNGDNEWEGYLVRATDDVALRYNVDGDWIGIVV